MTSFLMLLVGVMLWRSAVFGQRSWMYGSESERPNRCKQYGPFLLQQLAACLIIADPLRHVLFDVGLWAGCSNNPTYSRINTTNAFPDSCYDSSYQYRCTVPCCVPMWLPSPGVPTGDAYEWFPPQSQFPTLATLTPNNTVWLPTNYSTTEPWVVWKAPAVLWELPATGIEEGAAHTTKGPMTAADCKYGVNEETGYCFLVNESLPLAEKLQQLPLRDAGKPYDPVTNPHECNCNQCTPHETMSHLAPLGVVFTIIFTYVGFVLLACAVAWNANIVDKLKNLKKTWRRLRGQTSPM